ncbi:MAG: MarR family winged helix-turn-helix transcriptional regulator [Acidimicrobiales bacterium]
MLPRSDDDPIVRAGAAEVLLVSLVEVAHSLRRTPLPGGVQRDLALTRSLAPRHVAVLVRLLVDGPMSVSVLAERLGVALTTASLLVGQLAEAGLVDRREDESDHRRTLVSIAKAHQADASEFLETRLKPLRRAIERLGAKSTEALVEGLSVLAEELSCGLLAARSTACEESEEMTIR